MQSLLHSCHTGIADFINSISINHRQRFFSISSDFNMYCGGCDSIPFWRWLKRNQQFSFLSVTCIDYGGEYLYNLQPNTLTDCFGRYMRTWFGRAIKCIANTLKISTCVSMKMIYPHSWNNFYVHWYTTISYVYCHIYINTSIVRYPRVDIPR